MIQSCTAWRGEDRQKRSEKKRKGEENRKDIKTTKSDKNCHRNISVQIDSIKKNIQEEREREKLKRPRIII